MKRVMLHELLHAFLFESGVCEYVEAQAEEMICQSLSGFLNGILNWTIRADSAKTSLNS
jgi:alanine-alpha-ketoisovalerate/valine-pyruvate aminotransferase